MKERSQNRIGLREKEDALLNFVSRQAQEAILTPNLPERYKDELLEAAIGTIQKVAERRAAYYAKYGEGRRTRRSEKVYKKYERKRSKRDTTNN